MQEMWTTYDEMAEKALKKELNMEKTILLMIRARDAMEEMIKICPDAYWKTYNQDGGQHSVEYWKKDLQIPIKNHNKFIKKHQNI